MTGNLGSIIVYKVCIFESIIVLYTRIRAYCSSTSCQLCVVKAGREEEGLCTARSNLGVGVDGWVLTE